MKLFADFDGFYLNLLLRGNCDFVEVYQIRPHGPRIMVRPQLSIDVEVSYRCDSKTNRKPTSAR